MKYILLVTFVAFCALSTLADPSLSIGLGTNYSTISGSDSLVTSTSPRVGLNFKLGFEQNFSRHFSLATGVSFETRGERNKSVHVYDTSFTEETSGDIDILNLQVPLLAQYNLPFSIFSFNVFAGPELGIFLTGEKRTEVTSHFAAVDGEPARSAVKNDTIDFSKKMNMVEFGVNFGLGFEIKTGTFGAIFVKPGVYLGLTNILKNNLGNDTTDNLSGTHTTFYFTFGYKFNAKPKKCAVEKNSDNLSIRKNAESNNTQSSPVQYDKSASQDSNGSSSAPSEGKTLGSGGSGSGSDSTP